MSKKYIFEVCRTCTEWGYKELNCKFHVKEEDVCLLFSVLERGRDNITYFLTNQMHASQKKCITRNLDNMFKFLYELDLDKHYVDIGENEIKYVPIQIKNMAKEININD